MTDDQLVRDFMRAVYESLPKALSEVRGACERSHIHRSAWKVHSPKLDFRFK